MVNKIQLLLNGVNAILKEVSIKKAESRKRGEQFNMFGILGVAHYEVTHSAIIASFLNPKECHGQGDKFLRIFLDTVGNKIMPDTSNANVFTEYSMNEGRIDILIDDGLGHGIIIENKIYALDQPEQLIRYNSFAQNKYGLGNYSIYYLTLFKDEASSDSAKGVEYNCISYTNDIINWLDGCIKESVSTPLIRETLLQYINHIKKLTNQDMEAINKEEMLQGMANNAEAVAAICNIQDEYIKYIYYHKLRPKFEEFCINKNLVFEEDNLFGSGKNRGFYFRKKEWFNSAIYIFTESTGEHNFYWGISNYQEELMNVEQCKLDCLHDHPTKTFPYGSEWLNGEYWDWRNPNTILKMVNGDYLKYITRLVTTALEEIDRKKLPMP